MTQRAKHGVLLRALVLVASVAAFAPLARAGGDDRAGADFTYGLAEMRAGRYEAGCPALEESYRLDPRPGTLFTLAECNLKRGKTASSLAQYEQFILVCSHMPPDQRAAQSERLAIANEERASLATSVPRLVVRLHEGAPAAMLVRLDDVVLGGPLLGAAIPVDPGEHTIVTETPDGRRLAVQVNLAEGEQKTVVAAPPPPGDIALRYSAPRANPLAPIAPPPAPHRPTTYVVGAAGLLGIAVAGMTGLVALGKASTARRDCDAMGVCSSAEGASAGNSARAFADASTVSLSIGVVGLAAAVVLWLTESASPAPRSIAIGSF